MNAFEYLNEMKDAIVAKKNATTTKSISIEEHYQEMLNMIDILKTEMEMAEYNYVVETIEQSIHTFEEHTVLQQQLNQDLIIIQPLSVTGKDIEMIDINSLCDILTTAKDNDLIKEDIIVIPPNVSVLKAKLKR